MKIDSQLAYTVLQFESSEVILSVGVLLVHHGAFCSMPNFTVVNLHTRFNRWSEDCIRMPYM